MSPSVNKVLPPGLVFVATLYFGWPPPAPLLHDDSTVRATAVRWNREDLQDPPPVSVHVDPFASVLLVSDQLEVEQETGKLVPTTRPPGPDPAVLQRGLTLSGIAQMGGLKWAILNGRPRLPGDTLITNDLNRHLCEVVSVGQDHVVVRCEETLADIQVGPSKQNSPASQLPGVKLHPVSVPQQTNHLQIKDEVKNSEDEPAAVQEATEKPLPPNHFGALGKLAR